MSIVNARNALLARLATLTPPVSTAFENQAFTPTAGTPYQTVTLLPNTPDNPSMGSSYYREVGLLQVSLCYPTNKGSGDALARAQLLRDHFPRGLTLTSGGDTIIVRLTPSIAPAFTQGDRYIVPVTIDWFINT